MWLIALFGMVLPWIAVPLAIGGLIAGLRGEPLGWLILVAAAALLVLDVLIDVFWAHRTEGASDAPDLNRRSDQLIGRLATVVEPIEAGRGKVRIGDSVWPVEGPPALAGERVEVIGSNGVVLRIRRVADGASG